MYRDSGHKVTVGGEWSNTDGGFIAQSGTVNLYGGGSVDFNGEAFYDLVLRGMKYTLADTLEVKGDLAILKGTLDVSGNDYKVTVSGSWLNKGGNFIAHSGTVILKGLENVIQSNSKPFYDLTLNKSVMTLADTLDVQGDFTMVLGILDVSEYDYKMTVGGSWLNMGGNFISHKGTVEFDGSGTIISDGEAFHNIVFNDGAKTYTLDGDLKLTENFILRKDL